MPSGCNAAALTPLRGRRRLTRRPAALGPPARPRLAAGRPLPRHPQAVHRPHRLPRRPSSRRAPPSCTRSSADPHPTHRDEVQGSLPTSPPACRVGNTGQKRWGSHRIPPMAAERPTVLIPWMGEARPLSPPQTHPGGRTASGSRGRADTGFAAPGRFRPSSNSAMRCRAICDGLGSSDIDALPDANGARLPASVRRGRSGRGRRHDLSILQEEFSLTQMLETPISGRIFLEQVIRDNLDIGRPDQVGLLFARRPIRRCPRATPGRFRTRVITAGVIPSLQVDDKHHDQAVREGPAHRDHHHRHQRFRDRETTDESARAAGDRRPRQPAPARRPTNRPRPDHRGPMPCTPSPHPSPPRPAPASQAGG